MDRLAAAQEALGISFRDPSLLRQALIHGSYSNENPALYPVPNERLEFLGDAVLGLVVAARLYLDFPDLSEGELTKLRALLVRGYTLARVARRLGLGNHLYLGKGEAATGGSSKPANLAGALEAVIGAVYLDQGLDAARDFVSGILEPEMDGALRRGSATNYKSELQEMLQARERRAPSYRVVRESGPDHEKLFTVEVVAGDSVLGTGTGKSKKAAETEAARTILEQLRADYTR